MSLLLISLATFMIPFKQTIPFLNLDMMDNYFKRLLERKHVVGSLKTIIVITLWWLWKIKNDIVYNRTFSITPTDFNIKLLQVSWLIMKPHKSAP